MLLLTIWVSLRQFTENALILPSSASRHALLAKDLVTWQAMVGRHILEDIVGKVAQYVDEHYPVDKTWAT
ncbi:hypothetical protein TNCV_3962921 [Trichonephila clavipes]|nr:hypothetical protein TNCV_3962921 [Trichonephila clavipes]